MAHFAELDEKNVVLRVIVVNNSETLDIGGSEDELTGIQFCQSLFGGRWVQTSYNGTIRKRFAAAGMIYDEQRNAFIHAQPFQSWVFNEQSLTWEPPTQCPQDGKNYEWDEGSVSWILVPTKPQIVTSDETTKS